MHADILESYVENCRMLVVNTYARSAHVLICNKNTAYGCGKASHCYYKLTISVVEIAPIQTVWIICVISAPIAIRKHQIGVDVTKEASNIS